MKSGAMTCVENVDISSVLEKYAHDFRLVAESGVVKNRVAFFVNNVYVSANRQKIFDKSLMALMGGDLQTRFTSAHYIDFVKIRSKINID